MKGPTEKEVLLFVRENSHPFVTTNDVAEEFSSVSKRTIRKRLNSLVANDQLSKREVGANSVVWHDRP
ncbi:DeoR family transcriptional regulator [Haloarcula marismortui]|uniref:DeoR family transcriptional regulator n=1 Tax=Haloarcula marismortui TaxID=2238 RepID=UPI001494CCE5